MTILINGSIFYRIGEALEKAKLSRSTYFRWVRDGRIEDARYRDRNGRRVLTPEEVRALVDEANQLVEVSKSDQMKLDLETNQV